MLDDAARHRVVITAEDGIRQGGAGMFVADALRSSVGDGVAPPVIRSGRHVRSSPRTNPITSSPRSGSTDPVGPLGPRSVAAIGEEPHGSGPAGPSAPLPATVITNDVLD